MSVLFEINRSQGRASIRLNRPNKNNSIDAYFAREITEAFTQASIAPEVNYVLFTGEGDCFCAGADLHWMKAARQLSEKENLQDVLSLSEMYRAILECPVPVLAQVTGKIRGGGVGLTASCDLVACHEDADFALPEASLGLTSGILTPILVRRIGIARFLEYSMTQFTVSAAKAHTDGLVSFIGNATELDGYLQNCIDAITKASPSAIRQIKASAKIALDGSNSNLCASLFEYANVTAKNRVSPDAQTRISSFLNRKQLCQKM